MLGNGSVKNCLEYMLFLLGVYASSIGLVWATLWWILLYFLLSKYD